MRKKLIGHSSFNHIASRSKIPYYNYNFLRNEWWWNTSIVERLLQYIIYFSHYVTKITIGDKIYMWLVLSTNYNVLILVINYRCDKYSFLIIMH